MKTIAPLAIALMAANPLSAAEKFLDWQFNETSGTALNATVNSGTRTINNTGGTEAPTTWNFGGARTRDGVLNIGDTQSFKWNPNSTANGGPTGASGQSFRTALLTTATEEFLRVYPPARTHAASRHHAPVVRGVDRRHRRLRPSRPRWRR